MSVQAGSLRLSTSHDTYPRHDVFIETLSGADITSRLVFKFKDGSLYDETTVFSQPGHFQFVSDHLVQRGPSFPHEMDMTIRSPRTVRVRHSEDGKKEDSRQRTLHDRN